mmetsp:Transcript_25744/g.56759  ORF Transcript_25744/g.56759 Transcript_25744/m.56759 type:complete len:293 (-) Transcript_25744:67-945(-)
MNGRMHGLQMLPQILDVLVQQLDTFSHGLVVFLVCLLKFHQLGLHLGARGLDVLQLPIEVRVQLVGFLQFDLLLLDILAHDVNPHQGLIQSRQLQCFFAFLLVPPSLLKRNVLVLDHILGVFTPPSAVLVGIRVHPAPAAVPQTPAHLPALLPVVRPGTLQVLVTFQAIPLLPVASVRLGALSLRLDGPALVLGPDMDANAVISHPRAHSGTAAGLFHKDTGTGLPVGLLLLLRGLVRGLVRVAAAAARAGPVAPGAAVCPVASGSARAPGAGAVPAVAAGATTFTAGARSV